MNGILETFLLAMTPLGELRAAIPIGVAVFHLNWVFVFLLSVFGNLIPVFFLLLFLKPISVFLSRKSSFFKRFFAWLFERTDKKMTPRMLKFQFIGLALFVGVPLPLTGAWTGSIIAFLLKMPFCKSFLAIFSGVIIAGIAVSALTMAGIAINQYFGWKALLVVSIVAILFWLFYRFKKKLK